MAVVYYNRLQAAIICNDLFNFIIKSVQFMISSSYMQFS